MLDGVENTFALLETVSGSWFVSLSEAHLEGPLTTVLVYQGLLKGDWGWAHWVWGPSLETGSWQRLVDRLPFQAFAPPKPSEAVFPGPSSLKKQEPANPASVEEEEGWFIFWKGIQRGPLQKREVLTLWKDSLSQGGEEVFVWKWGWPDWKPWKEVPWTNSPAVGFKAPLEQRIFPRIPWVAQLLLNDSQTLRRGLCRDISLGGMQVLMESPPQTLGLWLRVNVSPSSGETAFAPFLVEGRLVRLLEDGRGFCIRFERLSDAARKQLEQYVAEEIGGGLVHGSS